MVLDTSLLNIQQYNVRIKSKVEQPKERSSPLSPVAIEKEPSGHPRPMLPTLLTTIYKYILLCYLLIATYLRIMFIHMKTNSVNVSLIIFFFSGVLTFMGYLKPKLSFF